MIARLLILALFFASSHQVLAGEAVSALSGTWKGKPDERSLALPDPGSLALTIAPDGAGFRVDLQMGALGNYQARFVPTGQLGVYEAKAGGLFAMFATKPPPNPLQGGDLVWAREEGGSLSLYRLDLPNGRMRLDQMVLRADGKAMTLQFEQRRSVAGAERMTARLERQGTAP